MWEDTSAWNAYADPGTDIGSNWDSYAGEPTMSYDQTGDWAGSPGPGGGYDQSWSSNIPSTGSNMPSMGGMNSDQNYSWEPKYTSGSIYNPSVTQMLSGNPSTEQLYNRLGGMEGATFYRNQPGYVNNPQLRDVEHYAAVQEAQNNPYVRMNPFAPIIGAAMAPAYSGAKYLAQNAPAWLQPYLPGYLTQASPPSWNEVWAGVKPWVWGR